MILLSLQLKHDQKTGKGRYRRKQIQHTILEAKAVQKFRFLWIPVSQTEIHTAGQLRDLLFRQASCCALCPYMNG